MLPFPKAVLFDWDNTLVDSLDVALQAMNTTLDYFGHPAWSMEKLLHTPHLSLRDSFEGLFKENAIKAMEIYNQAFEKIHLKNLKALPYAVELLSFLQGLPIFVGVVSNKVGKFLRLEIEILGWNRYFTSIMGSHDCEYDKPSPIPVIETLKKGFLSPSHEVWFVGDSAVDMQCARNAGCLPIFVGDHLDSANHGPDIIRAENCLGVLSMLKDHPKIAV